MSTSAWVRAEDNTYGEGRFPFGRCQEKDCIAPACHRDPARNGLAVCRDHLDKRVLFAPFMGQQEKLYYASARWVLGGGGAGGSKTYCGSRLWLKQYFAERARVERGEILRSQGWAIFFRRTMPELLQVIDDFKAYFKKIDPRAEWHAQEKLATFSNGYKVQFGGMEDDSGWLRYYGNAYSLVVFDEATTFTKTQIVQLDSRLRCADPALDKQVQLYLLTNPIGGATKAWLKKRYVKVAAPETHVRVKVKLADGRILVERQVYIPCNLYDNPALLATGRYEANLMTKGAAMKRALLHNDWDVDEGTWVGEDWDRSVHVRKPFPIPKHWARYKSGDYGYSSRTSIGWWAINPMTSQHICYRALSTRRVTARQLGHLIKRMEQKPLMWRDPITGKALQITGPEWDDDADHSTVLGPMDQSLWNQGGEDGESRGEILETLGCGFYRSDKGKAVRHDAADHFRELLRMRIPDERGNEIAGICFFEGTTETKIVDEEGDTIVTGPIHTIPELPFAPEDPDVPDTDADDHDWDMVAYYLMSRPWPGNDNQEEAEVIDFMQFRSERKASGGEKIGW